MAQTAAETLEFPRALKVDASMLEAIEKTHTVMLETIPKVRYTLPLQEDLSESILEAVLLKSLIEDLEKPDNSLTPKELDEKHENINHRYSMLMLDHTQFKEKVARVSTTSPRSKAVKRRPTDDDVPEDPAPDQECPDTQPLMDEDQLDSLFQDSQFQD